MLTIGFTNHYYTLWQVTSAERYDAGTGAKYLVTNYMYLQNLSMDFESAKDKISDMTNGNYDVDLTLRGQHGTRYFTERMIQDMDIDRFTFGKLSGSSMLVCDDTWQLNRAMNEEPNPRRRVISRRRLIELGYLVNYAWQERKPVPVTDDVRPDEYGNWPVMMVRRRWCPVKLATALQAKKLIDECSGHFFTEGKRLELSIKLLKQFYFETVYGTTYIQIFITPDNQVVKYKGSTPVSFTDLDHEEYIKVKATIKHGEYQGTKETMLQRVKVLSIPRPEYSA